MQTQVGVENVPGEAGRDRVKRPEGTWRGQKIHKHTVPRAGEPQLSHCLSTLPLCPFKKLRGAGAEWD